MTAEKRRSKVSCQGTLRPFMAQVAGSQNGDPAGNQRTGNGDPAKNRHRSRGPKMETPLETGEPERETPLGTLETND